MKHIKIFESFDSIDYQFDESKVFIVNYYNKISI